MGKTIIMQLAEFVDALRFEDLPNDVVEESKRIILDSIGCAIGGTTHDKGGIGIEFARSFGSSEEATVIGCDDRLSCMGASFANGELMNALDFDAILPPGHVTPYVLPAALAVGESIGASGRSLIVATALAHEMSYRIGKALDYMRDIKDGKLVLPPIFGYSCTIFGSAAGAGKLKGFDKEVMADALGIAGSISPVNSHWTWTQHSPSTTIKYLHAGWLNLGALTAAGMAELGHKGDIRIMDDEWGYWRFIGSSRWEPSGITGDLGKRWLFPPSQSYKVYPHCRVLAAPMDALMYIVEENDIKPEEIEGINALIEGICMQPVWLNRTIENPTDAQFSVAHGLSLAAHRIPPGKRWQDRETVMNPSVFKLMDKVSFDVHPDYIRSIIENPAARPSRVEVKARGKVFIEERLYPKGSPSPQPETFTTMEELVAKFKSNAQGVLPPQKIDSAVSAILDLEAMDKIAELMEIVSLRPPTTSSEH